ncbi:NADH dehydrogenase subunit 2 (mitochondrion) [Nothobranchius furzeri]|uniref:NADH-ubiquinone oxidoreductase chain 2 n=1 Tax=Nothobranchius furzeri TaxID=105023 RepID=Q9TD63_NOTFU|nr:NADH dehydrogenase subunit 2 [Nothobranchius furzeri]AAF02912.1 NADH dehydrogenase subunit II [Nothobranchius furzeri]ACD03814.1 NADH dehydrogenase subunit 2 [Nothobranchius furzeri]
MSPLTLLTMAFTLMLGTTITLMSTHWLLAWMGLEINTLAIIPLMIKQNHPRAVEATTKYFLIQATAATTLLFAATTNAWLTGAWEISQVMHPLPTIIITMALSLKMGLAPMHSWLPDVMQGLELKVGLVLATWQKLAPFSLLCQIPNSNFTILLGLTSIILGGWGGLNQTQLRKIMAYSSIAHLGWMLLVMQLLPSLSLMTLLVYIIMTFSLFNIFMINKTTNINSLSTSSMKVPVLTTLTPLILLSLGGLPPLTGFLPKWLILQEMIKQNFFMTATMAALSALLSLYFYLRLSYNMTFTIAPNTSTNTLSWRLNNKNIILPTATSMTMTLLMLPLLPLAAMPLF